METYRGIWFEISYSGNKANGKDEESGWLGRYAGGHTGGSNTKDDALAFVKECIDRDISNGILIEKIHNPEFEPEGPEASGGKEYSEETIKNRTHRGFGPDEKVAG